MIYDDLMILVEIDCTSARDIVQLLDEMDCVNKNENS